ncbi:MAG: hypothetical protein UU73_C0001G0071 [Candidatus Daviesbacteria bacterium GW2011_GWA1_41_61]|uniref:HPr kinase n=1 Tax=Candidatus Daviesbacteria bacterium GW2011_GWA2_40_9 TaxID=1618424 RepID=A0A0G0U1H4_9BACT|nr:MAG: hypothetical protein UU26_C0002G0032 [Candidatus Daviesbacteria bacterium GW2011_GWC1_40_9]KKR82963.1 MAG: hypothetical protein UU29_C0008G0072 [Candidatus Daviesbacteria bacterium GW2011_GWA2_40_9]KKR92890.1 MAG: hypothetical protein UU44_C0004G0072 [Candidatus Daviesbacteria bacterium GW2011_GWB1_41_15]KKS15434.1 MAG: hypothetical protein UU73_C0001G0071 [Candidatus Daviesbacteria bacterium GW2011_GWA1_41_61]
MNVYKCTIRTHNVLISLQTDSKGLYDYIQKDPFLHAHIADAEILPGTSFQADFKIIHKSSRENQITMDERSLEIYANIPDVIKYSQIIFLLIPILEMFYEQNDIYSISGAAISNFENGLILLGGQRAGKSTLTSILTKDNTLSYFSDERLLLNSEGGIFLGGNKAISLRKNIAESEMFSTSEKGKFMVSSSTNKLYYFPETRRPKKAKLKYLCLIQLNNIPFYTVKLNNFDIKLQLYNNITQTIRSCLNPIINLEFATPSFDNKTLSNKRLRKIAKLIDTQDIEGYELNGSIEEIKKWIKRKII